MQSNMNTHPTFNDIIEGCRAISSSNMDNDIDAVISLNRGGLIAGVMLSHLLSVPHHIMDVMCDESAGDNIDQHTLQIPVLEYNIINILLIDDIIDTGSALIRAVEILKVVYPNLLIHTAVLYHKELSHFNPNSVTSHTYINTIPEDAPFIHFPWEL